MTTEPTPSRQGIARLLPYEQHIGYGLIAAGLALSAIPIVNGYQHKAQSLAVLTWGALLALFVLGMGAYALTPTTSADTAARVERLRWIFLLTAGVVGALTAFLGLILPFCKAPMALTNYQEIFTGGPKAWRENGWAVGRCVLALLGGLVLMFVGLQLARPVERTSLNMRRWLYGYNAVLSSLLLLFILVLVNVLPYTGVRAFSWAMSDTDWTTGRLYTLHEATKNLLTDIKEPIKVYALLPGGTLEEREMVGLLNNCRAVNPQFTWEELSPDRNRMEVNNLMLQYQIPEREGLLVLYGGGDKPTTQFIKLNDLIEFEQAPGGGGRNFTFKGENALVNALTYLSAGKRAAIYFTQGNGELDLNDQNRRQLDVGLGVVQDELGKINFETHPLPLGPKATSIPEDADVVVIARPREEFSPNALKALRDYLHGAHRKDGQKGKLMVLFDVDPRKGEMIHTGLESLMAEYGVKVGDNRVMSATSRNPLQLTVVADPRSASPVAQAFRPQPGQGLTSFTFFDARTVEPAGTPGGVYTVDTLILLSWQRLIWAETDLRANPLTLVNQLRRDQEKLLAKISEKSLSLAVTVTEGKSVAPRIPGHEGLNREGEPRMIVFGDASWASNLLLMETTPDNFNLFSSSVSWLSGRHDIGARVPPRTSTMYRLRTTGSDSLRLVLLPGALMILGVFALGFGVWIVRRR